MRRVFALYGLMAVAVGVVFALAPSPSLTAWERGVGAHGGVPFGVSPSPSEAFQSGNPTAQPSKSHTLGVVLDYPASDLAAQLSQLKAQGVQEVVLRLEALPSREAWQSLLETAEASGLEWRLWLASLPRTDGWTILQATSPRN